jgi:hypothetical protein
LYGHHEVLYALARLLEGRVEQIRIFTTLAVRQDAWMLHGSADIQWFTFAYPEDRTPFIRLHLPTIDECDLVIFTTIASDFRFFASLPLKTRSLLIVHNAHTFFQPWRHISLSTDSILSFAADCLRLARFILRREAGMYRKLLTRFDYIGLPSEEVLQYVLENRLSPKPEVCLSVPFTFFEGRPFPPAREEITITVPGAITGNGRDYAMLLECFGKVLPGIEEKVRLILLGMPKGRYSRDIQREFKALQSDNFRVETFSGPVPQRDFDAFLESTDFVILPLLPRRRFSIFVEKTGYSNRTGGVNDIIRFGIPALLPSFYPLAPQGKNLPVSLTHPLQIPKTSSPLLHFPTSPLFKNVAQICERYHDAEDLSAKLPDWIENKRYLSLRAKAATAFGDYKRDKVADEFFRKSAF